MNPHSLRCLEYQTILDLLADLAVSPLGRDECLKTTPSANVELITISHRQVKEIGELESAEGALSLSSVHDIRPHLKTLQVRGATLDANALLEIKKTIHTVSLLYRWKNKCDKYYPNVRELFSGLVPLEELYRKINESVSDWGTIKDSASPELQKIRKKLHTLREKINANFGSLFERKGIAHIFQDRVISVRNNRFVVPVRAESKGVIKGIIHDASQSGATVYLEPLELVSLNNEWNELHQAEKAEERRILANLSNEVRENSEQIEANLELLGKIDCIRAKARLGKIINGIVPELSNTDFKLNDAYHPLLLLQYLAQQGSELMPDSFKKKLILPLKPGLKVPKPVPISLVLTPACHTLIISGPNAGGKTVTLKTVGLLSLMNQSGIPVPVKEGSLFRVFEGIFVDIGDEQDIQTHLSTFSARVQNLRVILESVTSDSLVLLDELGTGTDPTEGAALALAILEHLKEQGIWTLVTTHFHMLKAYAAITPEVENVSVSFDEATGQPTFRLQFGLSGTSNAFDIAMHHGFPGFILEKAKNFLKKNELEGNRVLGELEALQRATAAIKDELENEKRSVKLLKERLEEEHERLVREKNKVLLDASEKARKIINQAEKEFRKLLTQLRKEGLRKAPRIKHDIAVIKHRTTQELKPHETVSLKEDRLRGQVEVGEQVKIISCKKIGKLVRISRDKKIAEVQVGKLQIKVPPADLVPHSSRSTFRKTVQKHDNCLRFPVPSNVTREVNVVGKTVEEAIEELDKVIDSAILAGIDEITVIHGHGTGRLRAGIHSYLDSNPQVSNFYFPELRQGGRGVTVVELKG